MSSPTTREAGSATDSSRVASRATDSSRGATSRAATSTLRWGRGVGAAESVADAIEYMLSGEAVGKVVVRI